MIRGSIRCNEVVDLLIQAQEKLILLHDLFHLSVLNVQLLHVFVLETVLSLFHILQNDFILKPLVLFLIDDQLDD